MPIFSPPLVPSALTSVIIPTAGASLSGTSSTLDASATGDNGAKITKVQFVLTGGSLNKSVIGTASPTIYGYLDVWNTTSVANGTYTAEPCDG